MTVMRDGSMVPFPRVDLWAMRVSCGHTVDFAINADLLPVRKREIMLNLSARARLLLCEDCIRERELAGKQWKG